MSVFKRGLCPGKRGQGENGGEREKGVLSWRWDGKSWVGWHMEATVPLLSLTATEAVEPSWTIHSGVGSSHTRSRQHIFGSHVMKRKRKVGRTRSHFPEGLALPN